VLFPLPPFDVELPLPPPVDVALAAPPPPGPPALPADPLPLSVPLQAAVASVRTPHTVGKMNESFIGNLRSMDAHRNLRTEH